MTVQTENSNVLAIQAMAQKHAKVKLYKVYLHTQDDPAVQEMIVAASTSTEAKTKALGHVKKANPYKGARSHSQAVKVTRVLSARETGMEGCVVIHRIPLDVFSSAAQAANA